ncbi:MAG: hypothetical protein RBT65_12290 [Methanolobus sp.]|nr:hypothetical protein [Methanolobus sp.]
MYPLIAKKAIELLHITKGVENTFLLNEYDIKQIMKLEKKDEKMNSLVGKKHNIGVKQALRADILIAFLTNKDYDWPKDNLRIIHQGEIIGRDVSDLAEINRYKNSDEHCVLGNIVINHRKMKKFKNSSEAPVMEISAKPWKELENMNLVSEALIASPSRLTDGYIKSKIAFENKSHVGSFLVGLNLKKNYPNQSKMNLLV